MELKIFKAVWCGPCKNYEAVVDQFQASHPEITISKHDVEEEADLALEYNVKSLPTTILLKDGEIAEVHVGALSLTQLISMVR